MSSQIKMGNVDVSQRFIKEIRGFIKLWDPPKSKPLKGNITKHSKGYILHTEGKALCFVDPGTFISALKKTQEQMRVNWFEG